MQNSYGQKQFFSVDDFLLLQPKAYTFDDRRYYIVSDSVADRNNFGYVRQLMPGYLVVKGGQEAKSPHDGFIGIAHSKWKLSGRLAGLNPGDLRPHFSGATSAFIAGTPELEKLMDFLKHEQINITRSDARSGAVVISELDEHSFQKLLDCEWTTFVDVYRSHPREETLNSTQDLSVNHIGWIHARLPGLNGESLSVSIRERTADKSDIDLAGRIIQSPLEDDIISFHANQMATVIAGGGNSSEESKGISWASRVSSASFQSNLPDPDDYFRDYGISVQNHSYGFEIENFYGAQARAFDLQCNAIPALVHVFSAGNKGEEISSNGTYTGIPGFANLTGNLKMAKNVLVVGGHYNDYSVDPRNSRGPAYDGRIKPDIVAFGPEGTSDGAAYVSGMALLLQDAYRKKYSLLPSSALLRLALTLTADDPGNPGPDFVNGFGILNGKSAIQLIDNGQFIENELGENEKQEIVINIPAGSAKLRVGIAWNDPAAEAGSPIALVNDLDLELTEIAASETHFPWTLNSFPEIDSLQLPARRGKDQINNIEIVTLENPPGGQFRISVSAGEVTGSQKYAVAFVVDTAAHFEWTFPLSSDRIEAGREIGLRWNTTYTGNSSILASVNGSPYEEILADIDVGRQFASWIVPSGISRIRFRMMVAGEEYESDEFLASPILNFSVGYNCDESGMLQWNRLPGADNYILFNLGERYLSPVFNGTDTSFSFTPGSVSDYFALAPVVNGLPGRRSLTYNYRSTGALCYFRSFDAQPSSEGSAKITLELSTLFNVSRIVLEKKSGTGFLSIGETAVRDVLSYEFTDDALVDGLSVYRAAIHLNDGRVVYTDEDVLVYADESTYVVYPNPLTRLGQPLHILTDGNGVQFQLVDAQGKVVYERELIGTLFDLDLSRFPAGLYLYRFARDSKIRSVGRILLD